LVIRSPRGRVILLTLALCAASTLTAAFNPRVHFAYRQAGVHILIETTAGLVATLAAFLVAGRFVQSHRLHDLLLACSLSVLAAANVLLGAIPAAALPTPLSSTWIWAEITGQLVGAALFGLAAFSPDARIANPRRLAMWAAAALSVLIAGGLAVAKSASLPALATVSSINGPAQIHDTALSIIQFATMLAFGLASIGLVRRSERSHDAMLAWFAAGAVAATFARLNFFLYPAVDVRWVYIADLMRLLSYILIVAGAAYEIFGYWRNRAEAAVLEERRRIARDLHDGVAQELAYISRLARMPGDRSAQLPSIQASAGRALDESRRAIAALTRPLDEPLQLVLAQAAEEVVARTGGEVLLELEIAPHIDLDRDHRDAVVRVTCEAVSNAIRHGAARTIQVALHDRGHAALVIVDDGVGFDQASTVRDTPHGFGITGMRERIEALGGSFRITSRPGDGTRIEVTLR
jgi:signal transduction histidine kinase